MENEYITIESKAYKTFMDKLDQISGELQICRQLLEKNESKKEKFEKDWLETEEAAKILAVSERTLLRMRNQGKIPFSKIGSRIIYPIEEVKRYLSNTTENKQK